MKNILTIFILSFFLSGLCLPVSAQKIPEAPETLDDAKSVGLQIFNKLPESIHKVWQEQALPILRSLWDQAQGPLENYVKPKVRELIDWLKGFLGKEIEERKPLIQEEFEKEKEEMIGDMPSVWERLKNLWD